MSWKIITKNYMLVAEVLGKLNQHIQLRSIMDKINYTDSEDILNTTEDGELIKKCLDKINEIIDWINSQ